MKIFKILFYFFFIDFILSKTKVFKQVKQASTQRNLHVEASEQYTKQMSDIMQFRAEYLNLDRELIQKDIDRLNKDPIFKHKGVYGVVPTDKSGRLKVIHNIEQIVNKRPAKLTKTIKNRFTTRKPNPSQQKCGLWVKLGYMQFYPGFKQARVKLIFRSNCMIGPEIKYLLLKNQTYIPEFLEFKIGDKTFKVKYDLNSFVSRGYGLHMQQQFKRYKLYSFFKIKFKLTRKQKEDIRRQQIEINRKKCFDTCRYRRHHQKTICLQRCRLRHRYIRRRRYLKQIPLNDNQKQTLNLQTIDQQQTKVDQQKLNDNKQSNVHLDDGRKLEEKNIKKNIQKNDKKIDKDQSIVIKQKDNQNDRNLKLETSTSKKQKDRKLHALCYCKYCNRKKFPIERRYCKRACNARCNIAQARLSSDDRSVMHIPYKQALNDDEILSPGNHENQKGFFEYQIVDSIWNSSSVVNSNRKYASEKSKYVIIGKRRGRPYVKRLLKNRCILYGTIA